MAGYIGSKAVNLSTTGADINGDANIDGTLTSDGLTVDTNTLHVDATNNRVGIGTSSPSEELHIYSDNAPVVLIEAAADNDSRLRLKTPNDRIGYIEFGDTEDADTGEIRYEHSGNSMVFSTNGTQEAMRIDASGNVGIGTSSPTEDLTIASTSPQIRLEDTDASGTPYSKISGVLGNVYIQADDANEIADSKIDFRVDGTQCAIIDSSGNVGIGTSSPNDKLTISGSAAYMTIDRSDGEAGVTFRYNGDNTKRADIATQTNGDLRFRTNLAEAMRIDSSGNLLVGKTTSAIATAGTAIRGDNAGLINSARAGTVLELNRLTSDGDIVQFYKDGSTVGSIGVTNDDIFFGNGPTSLKTYNTGNAIHPYNASSLTNRDNAIDLGMSAIRFDDIYATNGTIQTSDRNEKQDIAELTDAEQRVAVAAKGLLRKFRWKDAVAEKGDEARTHFGIIAQDLQAAFAAEGLDAGDYAMFISSTWTDEETGEERTRMGVRYSELLAFIIGAL